MIPFNKPYMTGKELYNIAEAHFNGMLAGDGPYSRQCHDWLRRRTGATKALLTHSCTAALEMAALLLDIEPGDEVIMPSFTFVSTANAFVLRGGIPVFIDIREDTLNLDERLIERAITPRTKAIVPVHYAGVSCEMDSIITIARVHGLKIIEDAAQGLMASYKGRALGSLGDMGAFSFHETKNVICGEGGALLVRDSGLGARAEVIREKGTDRSRFFRGEVDKYTWQDIGSSFLPGEITAAFLAAQLAEADEITRQRLEVWERYHSALAPLEARGLIRRPIIPADCSHNAHMYYVLIDSSLDRNVVLDEMRRKGVAAVFHYVPLHSSPGGRKHCRADGDLPVTEHQAKRLIRLPVWVGLPAEQQDTVISTLAEALAFAESL